MTKQHGTAMLNNGHRKAGKNPNIAIAYTSVSSSFLHELYLKDQDKEVLLGILRNKHTLDKTKLKIIENHPRSWVSFSRIENLPATVWNMFATSKDIKVLRNVLAQPGLDYKIYSNASTRSRNGIRIVVARNPHAPGNILARMVKNEGDYAIMKTLAQNPTLPRTSLNVYLKHANKNLRVAALGNHQLGEEDFVELVKIKANHVGLLKNEKISANIIARIWDMGVGTIGNADVMLRHPNISAETVHKIWNESDVDSTTFYHAGTHDLALKGMAVRTHLNRGGFKINRWLFLSENGGNNQQARLDVKWRHYLVAYLKDEGVSDADNSFPTEWLVELAKSIAPEPESGNDG